VTSYILRRLLQAIPTFLGITIIAYAVIRLAPGDPLAVFEDARGTTAEQMAALRVACSPAEISRTIAGRHLYRSCACDGVANRARRTFGWDRERR